MNDFPLPAKDFLPHAAPMLCIDCLLRVSGNGAEVEVFLAPEHVLLDDGYLAEAGFVELAAQAAGAMKGYWEKKGGLPVCKGFLAAVQDFKIHGRAKQGDTLRVSVVVIAEVAGVTLVEAVVFRTEEGVPPDLLAQGKLKVFTFDETPSA